MLTPSISIRSRTAWVAIGLALGISLAACSPAGTPVPATASPPPTSAPTALPVPTATVPSPSATPAEAATPTTQVTTTTAGNLRLVLAADGNEARYLVREQLASLQSPNDAIGATQDVTGVLVLTPDGAVVSEESRFTVDLRTLRSDSSLRDGFIQRSTLETGQYPTAEFVPAEAIGLPAPLPTSGQVAFQLVGELTVHGATRPSTWEVTAQIVDGRELVGQATTNFTFSDFGMTTPSVARVLSIEETIRLEYDFHLVLEPAS